MLRVLARMAGHAAMLAGFALAVADGARSIAASAVMLLPLEQALTPLPGRPVAEWGGVIAAQVHPLLWDPLLVWLLHLPAAVACFLAGGILLLAGRLRAEAPAGAEARHPDVARGEV
jgi:hypothetical protein